MTVIPVIWYDSVKKFQVPSIGEGSGPAFSKFITTPLWTFCTNDSRHWFSILGEHTQYDRPRTKQSELNLFSVSALILTRIIENCSTTTHIDLCMDHWFKASPEHSLFFKEQGTLVKHWQVPHWKCLYFRLLMTNSNSWFHSWKMGSPLWQTSTLKLSTNFSQSTCQYSLHTVRKHWNQILLEYFSKLFISPLSHPLCTRRILLERNKLNAWIWSGI